MGQRIPEKEIAKFQFIFYNTVVYGISCIGTYSSAKFEHIKIYNILMTNESYLKILKKMIRLFQ